MTESFSQDEVNDLALNQLSEDQLIMRAGDTFAVSW